MKANKGHRNQRQIALEMRRADVARRYLQGQTQGQIAADLGVHQSQVTRDLKTLRQRWQEQAADQTGRWIAQELARLAALEAEAWAAWQRSRQNAVKEIEETTEDGFRQRKETTGQAGDPRFLDQVQKCVQQRRDLLGLDAPKRTELSGPGSGPIPVASVSEMDDEQLLRIAARGGPGTAAEAACEVEPAGLHDLHEG